MQKKQDEGFTEPIVIGLEIHAELCTSTKLFCSCPTQGKEEPNTRTCPVCLGMPGSKPAANSKAVEYALKIALALKCHIAKDVIFSRKSYFYPDLAKDYQITQYELPIGSDGTVKLGGKHINIKRVHLEEDPASLVHPGGIGQAPHVLVDYNRSGNPLCEIVTMPDLHSPEEAREFMKHLITILRYLEVYDPDRNNIKADANISIKESGYVRTEIKNITGFREIERALKYEIERQKQMVEEGHKQRQETRAWDAEKGFTSLLRTKETEEDYGYIFDPDLVPIQVKHRPKIPEMPAEKAERFMQDYKLTQEDASVITSEYAMAQLFEKAVIKINPLLAARWIRRELVRVLNYNNIDVSEMKINDDEFIRLLFLLEKNKITEKTGQRIIEKLAVEDINVDKYVKEHNLEAVSDTGLIEKYCKEAIAENPKAADDFKSGKELALNFLLGSVMKKSQGKADPKEVKETLKKQLQGI